jgi:protocatechuate 3,4-dioxygenase beta subunit
MKRLLLIVLALFLTACGSTPTKIPNTPTVSSPTEIIPGEVSLPTQVSVTSTAAVNDPFSLNHIQLSSPTCDGTLTPAQTEGPYYKSDTPERNSLYETALPGTRLLLVGFVLDRDCQSIPGAWLDFWQADANGEYDNAGYTLRGHQQTDALGRYFLETIVPGLYSSRPILHIHVKVQAPNAQVLTTQLYFPQQPIAGLTVSIEERGEIQVAYFNFIVAK